MSEAAVEAPQETPAPAEQPTDELGDAGKKALDAERKNARAAARERDALAARLKEFEDRDKTDQQKLAERAEAAEKRATDLESRSLRLEVAFEKGLTPAQAKRLVGTTRDELEADADEVLRDFPALKPDGRPRGDLDQGVRTPAPPLTDGSPRSLIAAGLASSDAAKHK